MNLGWAQPTRKSFKMLKDAPAGNQNAPARNQNPYRCQAGGLGWLAGVVAGMPWDRVASRAPGFLCGVSLNLHRNPKMMSYSAEQNLFFLVYFQPTPKKVKIINPRKYFFQANNSKVLRT